MKKLQTSKAPQAIGPYSQGVILPAGKELLFISGQLPLNPETGKLVDGDITILTMQVIDNLENILLSGNSSLRQVLRVEIFLTDLKDFKLVNEAYAKRFTEIFPARQTIQVAGLPMGSPIEISCIAYKKIQ